MMAEKGGTKDNKEIILENEERDKSILGLALVLFTISVMLFFLIRFILEPTIFTKESQEFKEVTISMFIITIFCLSLYIYIFIQEIGHIVILSPKGISKPSFFKKKNIKLIEFNQIKHYRYILNINGCCIGINITTKDNKIINYKKRFLKENLYIIDEYLIDHKIKEIWFYG